MLRPIDRMVLLAIVSTGHLFLSGCAQRELIETPNLYRMGSLDPFRDCAPAYQNNLVDILYATDRQPAERKDGGREYGYERSRSLAFGRCVVEIGKDVPWPVLAENSLLEKRNVSLPLTINETLEMGRFPEDPFPMVSEGEELVADPRATAQKEEASKAFRTEVSRRLQDTPSKEAFIFVHGYNNTFQHSVFVMTDLWHFLGRKGIPVVYSWPAGRGGIHGYAYDRESGEFTVLHLKTFLRLIASCPDLERIHLLAHSRGTDALTAAIRELVIEERAAGRDPKATLKIEDVTLAAPDLDLEVFFQRIAGERIGRGLGRVTVYVSEEDKALGLSTWLASSAQRLGKMSFENMDQSMKTLLGQNRAATIVDARVRSGFVGHSYFYADPAVSSDRILVMGHGRSAGPENGRPLLPVGPNFWRIEKGYPGGSN